MAFASNRSMSQPMSNLAYERMMFGYEVVKNSCKDGLLSPNLSHSRSVQIIPNGLLNHPKPFTQFFAASKNSKTFVSVSTLPTINSP